MRRKELQIPEEAATQSAPARKTERVPVQKKKSGKAVSDNFDENPDEYDWDSIVKPAVEPIPTALHETNDNNYSSDR